MSVINKLGKNGVIIKICLCYYYGKRRNEVYLYIRHTQIKCVIFLIKIFIMQRIFISTLKTCFHLIPSIFVHSSFLFFLLNNIKKNYAVVNTFIFTLKANRTCVSYLHLFLGAFYFRFLFIFICLYL